MTVNRLAACLDKTTQLPDPSDETLRIVAIAWPTGRIIYQYTPDELATAWTSTPAP